MLLAAATALLLQATPPSLAVWMQPVGTIHSAFESVREGRVWIAYLPLGASYAPPAWPVELHGELTITFGGEALTDASRSFAGALVSAGPVFRLLRSGPLRGPFVQPKLFASYLGQSAEVPSGFELFRAGSAMEIGLGLDVGWQLQFGRVYVTPVLGATVSLATGEGPPLSTYYGYGTLAAGLDPRGEVSVFQWGLNLNLVRIGVVF